MEMSRDVAISKALSTLLRHQAHSEGVPITADGWVTVSEFLQWAKRKRGLQTDEAAVRRIVAGNDKQRFSLREQPELAVRANQGHSMKDVSIEMSELPSDVHSAVHGTYHSAWECIKNDGLSRMRRQHIHLARDVPGESGVISGMRASCEVLVWVDVSRARAAGVRFLESANGVILTEGVDGVLPPAYFSRAVERATGLVLWQVEGAPSAPPADPPQRVLVDAPTAGGARGLAVACDAAPPSVGSSVALPPGAGPSPSLAVWKDGACLGSITLQPGVHAVGRSEDAAIVCEHPSCSRSHAAIHVHADQTVGVVDLGSAQGTRVDAVEIAPHQEHPLRDCARLQFGASSRSFLLHAPAAPVRASGLNADQKRKLLWAGKREASGAQGTSPGWAHQAASAFGDVERASRFLALTGAKRQHTDEGGAPPHTTMLPAGRTDGSTSAAAQAAAAQQHELFSTLERQFQDARHGRRAL